MKIAALKKTDPWFARLAANGHIDSDALDGVPVETYVEMELVELLHGGVEENYRPYLHLRGDLVEVKPAVELPYGVTELSTQRSAGTTIDVFYDFNQEQLASLVSKGYFSQSFTVPAEMTQVTWPLPGKADFLIVAPASFDEPPLVFMTVHDQSEMALDQATSGHELVQYFADVSDQVDTQHDVAAEPEAAPARDEASMDMYSDVVFDEHRPFNELVEEPQIAEAAARATVPDGVFGRLIAEIEGQAEADAPEVEAEDAAQAPAPGSAWDFYLSQVAPGVDHVLTREHLADADWAPESTAKEQVGASADETTVDAHEGEQPASEWAKVINRVDDLTDDAERVEVGVDEAETPLPGDAPITADGFIDYNLSEPETELEPLSLQIAQANEHVRAEEKRIARMRADLAADVDAEAGDESHPGL